MDVERTIEFLLEQQAAQQARSDARMTRIEESIGKLTESQLRADNDIRQLRSELRRAVRLSVQEARAERRSRKEADERLAAGQEALQNSLQAFIDSIKQPRNGHDKN